jgi:hypothetical protein
MNVSLHPCEEIHKPIGALSISVILSLFFLTILSTIHTVLWNTPPTQYEHRVFARQIQQQLQQYTHDSM